MNVVMAKTFGFCFGVKHALEMTEKALEKGQKIYILGDLIHNRWVIERLVGRGLTRVNSVEEVERDGTLIIGAHGVTREIYSKAERLGLRLIDTTCVFVNKAQDAAKLLANEDYEVFIVGDRDHTEVRGIVSAAGRQVNILLKAEDIAGIKGGKRAGLLFQTTQSAEKCRLFSDALVSRYEETRIFNTICRATSERQEAVHDLAAHVDAVIIVGDKKSANTKRLAGIAAEANPRSYMVESADQLDESLLKGMKTVGLTAGASTPDWIIEAVRRRLEDIPS